MHLAHFDIAHYAGHKALDELRRAYLLYTLPIAQAMRESGISGFSIDFKPVSDIGALSQELTVQDLDLDAIDPINAFHWSSYLDLLRQQEAKLCINACIFFQMMMEAVINDVYENTEHGFARKWNWFIGSQGGQLEDRDNFLKYNTNIYEKIRIATVHATKSQGLINAESIHFPYVHENLKRGWYCFVFLLNKKHGAEMDYATNWRTMSEEAHDIPADLSRTMFVHMDQLAGRLRKKHIDYFNDQLKQ